MISIFQIDNGWVTHTDDGQQRFYPTLLALTNALELSSSPAVESALFKPPIQPVNTLPADQFDVTTKRGRGRPRKNVVAANNPGPDAPASEVQVTTAAAASELQERADKAPTSTAAAPIYTVKDIYAALNEVNAKHGLQLCRGALAHVGAQKLSDVTPENFSLFMEVCGAALEKGTTDV